ncbi:MAG: DUF411 domain-containing protein [Rhodospirillaceae bacterium]|nr:DUF411 domain-containing protein [Rhodospirillaceae bacterium]
MKTLLKAGLIILALLPYGMAAAAETATVYRDPNCGCCGEYVKYLEKNGFRTKVIIMDDMTPIKKQSKVPRAMESCHTTRIGGYVVEGHVPVGAIKKLLADKPKIIGISVPGMPAGSPGMGGEKTEPLAVYEITDEKREFYSE